MKRVVIPIKAAWKALEKSSEGELIKNQKERMPFGYEANFCAYEDEENAASRASDGSSSHSASTDKKPERDPARKDPFRAASAQPGS